MPLTKDKKQELIGKFGREDGDTGSAEVQVALLTERINHLTEHLRTHQQGPPLAPRPADDGRQAPAAAPATWSARTSSATARSWPTSACDVSRLPVIAPGTPAPDFSLPNHEGKQVSLADFRGGKLMLVFYPLDFSPVCTDQLSIYQEVLPQIEERGASLVGISVDSTWAHRAFREKLGITIPLLSDFEPKGEVISQLRRLSRRGRPRQPLAGAGRRGGVVRWVHESPTPLEIPGANLIFDALSAVD